MKIYIAARAKYRAPEVIEIQQKLREMGHRIAYDWATRNDDIKKPYRDPDNRKANQAAQSVMLQAASEADIFILLDDEGLRGAYVEFGAFLANCIKRPNNRHAFIVGPKSHKREFIFESPSFVCFVDTIEEVYEKIKQ